MIIAVSELEFTGERVVPGAQLDPLQAGLIAIHQKVYQHIAPYCAGKRVLDLGCGTGHGSAMLLQQAQPRSVFGTDLAQDALRFAGGHFPVLQHRLLACDGMRLPFANACADVVSTVEVIEHVPSAAGYLQEIVRVLVPGGVCILSTPNRFTHSPGHDKPINPFHVIEFDYEGLTHLLRQHFTQVDVYCVYIRARGFMARYQPHALDPQLPPPFSNVERFLHWNVPPWKHRLLQVSDIDYRLDYKRTCFGFVAVCKA